jgi:hypothetical protein
VFYFYSRISVKKAVFIYVQKEKLSENAEFNWKNHHFWIATSLKFLTRLDRFTFTNVLLTHCKNVVAFSSCSRVHSSPFHSWTKSTNRRTLRSFGLEKINTVTGLTTKFCNIWTPKNWLCQIWHNNIKRSLVTCLYPIKKDLNS